MSLPNSSPYYRSPHSEALALFSLVGRDGNTVESLCELIAVPPEILEAWGKVPDRIMRAELEQIAKYRAKVMARFNRIVEESRKQCKTVQ